MAYLTNNDIDSIVEVFEANPGQDYRPVTRENYLHRINEDFYNKHLSDEVNNQYEQLRKDLSILSKTPGLVSGEVPLYNWLKEAERRFGEVSGVKVFKELLEKIPAKSIEEPSKFLPKPQNRYEKVKQLLKSKNLIKNQKLIISMIIGIILLIVFIPFKFVIENTDFGRWFEIRSYEILQSNLSKYDPDEELPIAVLDISDVQRDANGAVPPDKLQELVEGLIESGAKAIAINIKFTPRVDRANPENTGPRHDKDEQFFDFLLEHNENQQGKPKSKRVPVYLGVTQFDAEPESWLGSNDYNELAADTTLCENEKCDPNEMAEVPAWLQCQGYDRLKSVSKALADVSDEKPQPPDWLKFFLKDYESPQNLKEVFRENINQEQIPCQKSSLLVNYAKLELIEKLSTQALTKEAILQNSNKFKNKLVIIGVIQRGKTTASFNVVGKGDSVPGVFIHATATYTLIADPVYELKSWVETLLDFSIGLTLVMGIFIFRLWQDKSNDSLSQKGEGTFLGITMLVVFLTGIAIAKFSNILWIDFLFVLLATFLHSKFQNGAVNHIEKRIFR